MAQVIDLTSQANWDIKIGSDKIFGLVLDFTGSGISDLANYVFTANIYSQNRTSVIQTFTATKLSLVVTFNQLLNIGHGNYPYDIFVSNNGATPQSWMYGNILNEF
jgi:hypothetical protein